jgi:hypothetical protein
MSTARPATTPVRPWWAPGLVAMSYLAACGLASVITNPAHPHILAPVPPLLAALAGLLGALTIGPLAQRLRLARMPRLVVVTLLVYLLSTISNYVEAVLFIKGSTALVPVNGAILALGLAVPVTLLWKPTSTDVTVGAALRATLTSRPWWSWAWRMMLTTLIWVPVYFIFAAADAPFVRIYYHRIGTAFTVPDTGIIVMAELARGLLHVLVLGMLAALLDRDRLVTWFWLALAFATLNSWLPLVQRSDWPYFLRAANLVEITCDAVVFGAVVALLLLKSVTKSTAATTVPLTGSDHGSGTKV